MMQRWPLGSCHAGKGRLECLEREVSTVADKGQINAYGNIGNSKTQVYHTMLNKDCGAKDNNAPQVSKTYTASLYVLQTEKQCETQQMQTQKANGKEKKKLCKNLLPECSRPMGGALSRNAFIFHVFCWFASVVFAIILCLLHIL